MKRRQYITATASCVSAIAIAGCIGDNDDDDTDPVTNEGSNSEDDNGDTSDDTNGDENGNDGSGDDEPRGEFFDGNAENYVLTEDEANALDITGQFEREDQTSSEDADRFPGDESFTQKHFENIDEADNSMTLFIIVFENEELAVDAIEELKTDFEETTPPEIAILDEDFGDMSFSMSGHENYNSMNTRVANVLIHGFGQRDVTAPATDAQIQKLKS